MNIFELKEYICNEVKEGQKIINNIKVMNKSDKESEVQKFIDKNIEYFDRIGWYEGISLKNVNFNSTYKEKYDTICSNLEQIEVEHPNDKKTINKWKNELKKFINNAELKEDRGCDYLKKNGRVVFGFFLCDTPKDINSSYKELFRLDDGTFVKSKTTYIEKKSHYILTRDISYIDRIDSDKWNMESILINSMLAITEYLRKNIINMIFKIDMYNQFNKNDKNKKDYTKEYQELKKAQVEITELMDIIDKKAA